MAALNIKNDETYALARELADETGESLTEAVTTAVRERLARLRTRESVAEGRLAAIHSLAVEMSRRWGPHGVEADPAAFLYDEETGLPR